MRNGAQTFQVVYASPKHRCCCVDIHLFSVTLMQTYWQRPAETVQVIWDSPAFEHGEVRLGNFNFNPADWKNVPIP